MNTYIKVGSQRRYVNKYDDIPPLLEEFVRHEIAIKGSSRKSLNTYYVNLRQFFRFIKMQEYKLTEEEMNEAIIADITDVQLSKVTSETILNYLYYLAEKDEAASTRAGKLSAIKSFYAYACSAYPELFTENPSYKIDRPKLPDKQPVFLSEGEARELLKAAVKTAFPERDFCIVTLFLNSGMRLSELVNINLSHLGQDTLVITGKGNKQRTVYLNSVCLSALENWKDARRKIENIIDFDALFISPRTRKRLTNRAVQKIVEKMLEDAGLGNRGYSVHKLRHTAATLLYDGGADVLELKEILGHEHTSTTEIYTHVNNTRLKEVAKNSPLSDCDVGAYEFSKSESDT